MPESLDLEINDLPPEETLTAEEKERIAGAGGLYGPGSFGQFVPTPLRHLFTDARDKAAFAKLPTKPGSANQPTRAYVGAMFQLYAYAKPIAYEFAARIARSCGPEYRLLRGPMKSLRRADEKYGKGTPYWEMKDIVRVTILAPNQDGMARVGPQIVGHALLCGWDVIKDQVVVPKPDGLGYSGLNYVIQTSKLPDIGVTPEPVKLEIQGNVPSIIYGKEIEEDFRAMLTGEDDPDGADFAEQMIRQMKSTHGIVGGLHHPLYEIFGKLSAADNNTVKDLSYRYLAYLRRQHGAPLGPTDPKFHELCHDISVFLRSHSNEIRAFFKHGIPEQIALTPLMPSRVNVKARVAAINQGRLNA